MPMRRLILAALAVALAACQKIPDEVPYEASIGELKEPGGPYRVSMLDGVTLTVNGQPVAKLARTTSEVSIEAKWKGPKSALHETLQGRFALKGTGPCGPYEVPLESDAYFKTATDEQIAAAFDARNAIQPSLKLDMPARHTVFVDWGGSQAKTVAVGSLSIASGTKEERLLAMGCKELPPVLVDGKQVGTLEPSAVAHLVTLEPGVCHVLQTIGYGNSETYAPTHLAALPVVSLKDTPMDVLEEGPKTVRVGGGGTSRTRLTREPCR
jgi:hypothetical protein